MPRRVTASAPLGAPRAARGAPPDGATRGPAAEPAVGVAPAAAGAESLLARAALWQWAARAFAYPDAATLAALRDRPWQRVADPHHVPGALAGAFAAAEAAVDQLDQRSPTLAEEHTALFARSVAASPHGTAYGPGLGFERVHDMARVASFYEAFGVRVAPMRPELPDHVCAELEFVAVLLAKEAYAWARHWVARAARTAAARRLFLDEHLAPWFPRFAERLAQRHRLDFYPAAAALVLALLTVEGVPVPLGDHTAGDALPPEPDGEPDDEAELMGACVVAD